jgi:dsDNA-specific endonuclease/ATPase MutS2
MLGTEWAEKQIRAGKLTFYPTVKAEETKSTASGTSKESVAKRLSDSQAVLAELNAKKAAALAEKEAKKEAEKARKEAEKAEKEAKKEAEKAEKEAKKEAEKAEKEAKKEAEKARKEAEKAEEKARKEALKKTAPTAPKSVKPPPPPPPAVAVESVGEIIQMDDVMYWISNGNVYAYDCGDEKIQEYLGRLTGNGDDIPYGIQDGDEVTVAESVTA